MVDTWSLSLLLLMVSSAVQAQTWTRTEALPLPWFEGEDTTRKVHLSINVDRVAIGDPMWQGRGIVVIHDRNAGGVDSWELIHSIEGEQSNGAFGRSLALRDPVLFVACSYGLWQYELGSESLEAEHLLDTSATWSLAVHDSVLITCSQVLEGYNAGRLKLFESNQYGIQNSIVATRVYLPAGDPIYGACFGSVVEYNPPNLIIGDPCYRTQVMVAYSGLFSFFQVDTELEMFIGAPYPYQSNYEPTLDGQLLGMGFSRALALKGDTLFAGFGPAQNGTQAYIVVFRKNTELGWDRHTQIHPPSDWKGPEIGDYGTAIEVIGNELVIGTDHGLAFYAVGETDWVFQDFHDLGGTVSDIDHDGDLLAAAVPAAGLVYLYERSVTSIADQRLTVQELRIAPNPASQFATVLPFHSKCHVRTLLHTDALGRILERSPWDGTKSLELEVARDFSGTTFIKALDLHGRTCATGRLSWIAQ
jgi:hypothetical protein